MSIHYKYGGSTAERTINCPAWHNIGSDVPHGLPSPAALEGSLMHLLFEMGVQDPEFEPAQMLGEERIIDGVCLHVTDEHIQKVYDAYEHLENIAEVYGYETVWPEVVMNTDDETGGTADIIGMTVDDKVRVEQFGVLDLKTGDGYMVYAKRNDQLLFYAWQAIEKYKQEGFKFTDKTAIQLGIIQPSERCDDPVDIWETDLNTVLKWARKYKQKQKEAKAGILTPCAGSWCRFCPKQPVCPVKTGQVQAAQRIPKDSPSLVQLQEALAIVDDMEDWCRAVRKVAHEQAEAGVKLEGFKLVNKRAIRKWDEPHLVHQKFKRSRKLIAADYEKVDMVSPAQLEKVCKAKGVDFSQFDAYYSLQSSGTTLVKDTDPRPEALPLPALQAAAKRLKS